MLKKITLLLALLSSVACQHSPRKEYFALSANPIDFTVTDQTPSNFSVGIGPINIPEYLQRTNIAYWQNPNQLILLQNHYWAETLERGITRVVALELQALHHDWHIVQFPWTGAQRPLYSIKIDIHRLDAFADHAVIQANIIWINLQTKQIISSQRIHRRQDCAANSAAIAKAYSELLQQTLRAITAPASPSGG